MLVLIGKMETQFLELELAKLSGSTDSIHLLSALSLTLMDHVGTHKANDMVPFVASLYNLSPSPLRWTCTPEAGSNLLERQSWPPDIDAVLSAKWVPGEENIFGSHRRTQQARDLTESKGEEADT